VAKVVKSEYATFRKGDKMSFFMVGDTVKVHPSKILKDSPHKSGRTIYWMYEDRIGTIKETSDNFVCVALDENTYYENFYPHELELVKRNKKEIFIGDKVRVISSIWYGTTGKVIYIFDSPTYGVFYMVDINTERPFLFRFDELEAEKID